ncbi:MAG: hypothetical protein Q9160_003710 [Pyrenula sp. 1 TL-2023]
MNTTTKLRTATRHSKQKSNSTRKFHNNVTNNALDTDTDSDEPMEKDETEDRLEKLLFGDDAGFYNSLDNFEQGKDLILAEGSTSQEGSPSSQEDDLKNVDDRDLFFLDSGLSPSLSGRETTNHTAKENRDTQTRQVAWVDSDDERLTISLASNPRLRKLRNFEGEDRVSGTEYIKRLRRQYERLRPRPEWANFSKIGHSNKKGGKESHNAGTTSDHDLSSDDEADEEKISAQPLAALLREAGALTVADHAHQGTKRRKLRPDVIDIQRTKDIPGSEPSSVDSLSFHPVYPLLLSSGPAATVYLHHVSPHPPNANPLLTSLHLQKTPLYSTAFYQRPSSEIDSNVTDATLDPTRILLASRRRYFHNWTLSDGTISKTTNTRTLIPNSVFTQRTMENITPSPCGRYLALVSSSRKDGSFISILSTTSQQYQTSFRVDSLGGIASLSFWSTGDGMCVAGKNGEITEFSIAEQRVVARWMDEGAVGITVISLGGHSGSHHLGGSRWVAVGSSSGIVNIYDRFSWTAEKISSLRRPKPTRVFDQLTTPVSHLIFSRDGQMFVMGRTGQRVIHHWEGSVVSQLVLEENISLLEQRREKLGYGK